jgi:hypothetical protein
MPAELLMIVPTRGRPLNATELTDAWLQTSTGHCDLCFVVDEDDPTLDQYLARLPSKSQGVHTCIMKTGGTGMVAALNDAATHFTVDYPYLGFLGDDHRPRTNGWDRRFCDVLAGRNVALVYGNDLLQREAMPTEVALTSTIVATLGYMAPPQFRHLCVDLVWKDWGDRLGAITYLPDVVIEHMHPANGKAAMDEGYARVNSPEMTSTDAATYYDYRDNGGLDADVDKLIAASG